MKTKLLSIFACCSLFLCVLSISAQEKTYTNRYSMKLELKPDGTYALQKEKRYAKIVDLTSIPDLYVPYEHVNNKLTSKDYRLTETMEYTYKTHDGYELKMAGGFRQGRKANSGNGLCPWRRLGAWINVCFPLAIEIPGSTKRHYRRANRIHSSHNPGECSGFYTRCNG